MATALAGPMALRTFLLGSWAVSRALHYTRGGAPGPSSFDGLVCPLPPRCARPQRNML